MKKFKFIINFVIFFILLNKCYSNEIFNSYDLLPIKQGEEFNEISFLSSQKTNLEYEKINNNIESLNHDSFNKISYGLLINNFENFDLFSNLEISKNNYLRKNYPLKLSDKDFKIDFTILEKSNYRNWKPYFGLIIQQKNFDSFDCYEGQTYILRKTNSQCKNDNKNNIINSMNKKYIQMNASRVGLNFGIKRTLLSWNTKSILEFGLTNNYINYNLSFENDFIVNQPAYRDLFPQNTSWLNNNFYAYYKNSVAINPKWAYGVSFGAIKIFTNNLTINAEKKQNNENFLFETKFTRRVDKNKFLSIGGKITKNNLIGIEPLYFARGMEYSNNKNVSTLYIKFGLIFNNKEDLKINKNITELDLEYINIRKTDNKIQTLEKKETIIENKKDLKVSKSSSDLKNYAVQYAKLYDRIK